MNAEQRCGFETLIEKPCVRMGIPVIIRTVLN
jgi:hypothetical protein